jgi:hypothetical protein
MSYYPPGRFKSINPLTTGSDTLFQKISSQFAQKPVATTAYTLIVATILASIVFWLRKVYTDTPIYERKKLEKKARKKKPATSKTTKRKSTKKKTARRKSTTRRKKTNL